MTSIPPTKSADGSERCPHCGDPHPGSYTHCPKTGRSLRSGTAMVGRVVAGRYKIVGVLGEGGMGAVYVAEHVMMGRKVALKRLHPELAQDEKAVQRFQREARAAASTGHEHIVEILDLGYAEDGAPYLAMEHLRGHDLAAVIRDEGKLAPQRACRIVGQVLAALDAVHRREIVHRDLKPDNVFLTRRGGVADYVKILDFGISKMKQEEGTLDLTKTGVMMGTPFYMSPEQARGIRTVDASVDLYAVGVMLYECITGRLPYAGENYHALLQAILRTEPRTPSSLAPAIDPGLEAVMLRALAKTAGQRYPTARALCEALVPFGAAPLGAPEVETDFVPEVSAVIPKPLPPRTEALSIDGKTLVSPPAGVPDAPRPRRPSVPPVLAAVPIAPISLAPIARSHEPPPKSGGGGRYFFAASEDWPGEKRGPRSSEPGMVRDAARASVPPPERANDPMDGPTRIDPPRSLPPISVSGAEPTLKGAFFVGALEHIEERLGRPGVQKMLDGLDATVRARLESVILPMAWLPTSSFDALLRAAERALGTSDGSTAQAIGRAVAEREAQTTHRLFVQTATPSLAAERAPHFFRLYHARGEARPQSMGETSLRLGLDSGEPESVLYANALAGFFQRFLELAGAKDVKGHAIASRGQGDRETIIALRWRE